MKRLAELDAANPNVIREEAGTISCSSCGEKFKIAGRKDGFSHCSDHKGHKALDESANLDECGMGMMPMGGMSAPHTPASINITADSGDELSHMLRDIMTLAGRGHAEPDADNMPADAVAVDMAPPAEIDFDGGDDDNALMRGMMDKLNAVGDEEMGDEEETDEGTDGDWDNSPNHATDIGHYSDATPKGNDLSSHGDNEKPKVNGGGNPYAMEERLMAEYKKFIAESVHHHIVSVNGKEVDTDSLEIDGVDMRDYPDFADAYFSDGRFMDGSEMSQNELDQLRDEQGQLLYDRIQDSLHESGQTMAEGKSGDQYLVKSIGNKINPATGERCDFYVNPTTGKEVFCKPGQKVNKGDHVNPTTGKVTPKG
jgi:hypothetical protein